MATGDTFFRKAVRAQLRGDLARAGELYRRALEVHPQRADIWANFALLVAQSGELDDAFEAIQRARSLAPDDAGVRERFAAVLSRAGRCAEAVEVWRALLAEDPRNTRTLCALCGDLSAIGLHGDVIELIDDAQAGGIADARCKLQRAFAYLMTGDYAKGFADFEFRLEAGHGALPKAMPVQRWAGEPLAGKRLLIYPDQGLGDDLSMARFLPELIRADASVTLLARPPLRRLFGSFDPRLAVAASVEDARCFDFTVAAGSLPHCLGVAETGPPPPAKLNVPAEARPAFETVAMRYSKKLRIGFCWTGNLTWPANYRRSVSPDMFRPLSAFDGVQLFSLYKGDDQKALARTGMLEHVVDLGSQFDDLADTAAAIEVMDLVITTDTVIPHLAATLDTPVWLLLSYESFWMYGQFSERAPWYPSLTLFRQHSSGDWQGVMQRVTDALSELLHGAGPRGPSVIPMP